MPFTNTRESTPRLSQMDRKNKRAAQHQQQNQTGDGGNGQPNQAQGHEAGNMGLGNTTNGGGGRRGQPGHRRDRDSRGDLIVPLMQQPQMGTYMVNDASGSSARMSGYPISTAAGARDVDFPFGLPDDFQQQPIPGGHAATSHQVNGGLARTSWQHRLPHHQLDADGRGPSATGLASSLGRSHDALAEPYEATGGRSAALGSPAPGNAFGTSPFSHPGSHSLFYSESATVPSHLDEDGPRAMRHGGLARSMGRLGNSDLEAASRRAWAAKDGKIGERTSPGGDYSHDDDEAGIRARAEGFNEEDFLPSSLSELLTPAELERKRRSVLADSGGTHQKVADAGAAAQSMPARSSAASLWDLAYRQEGATANKLGVSPGTFATMREASALATSVTSGANALGSSHLEGGFGGKSFLDHGTDFGMSNRSAGFLGSRMHRTHDEHMDERLSQPQLAAGVIGRDRQDNSSNARASQGHAYSPDAKAALSHAPGQSLPQGLAAGLSRLHLRAGGSNLVNGSQGQQQGQRVSLPPPPPFASSHNANNIWPSAGSSPSSSSLLRRQQPIPSSPSVNGVQSSHVKTTASGARPTASSRLSSSHLDDLAPTAPSSLFPHRPNPLSSALGHRHGTLSSSSTNASPYLESAPTLNNHSPGGIAIPGQGQQDEDATSTSHAQGAGGKGAGASPSIRSHPGIQRLVRSNGSSSSLNSGLPPSSSTSNSNNAAPSPLALLPTTGEEVEEAIFELE